MPARRPLSMRPSRANRRFLRTRIWGCCRLVLSPQTRISPSLWTPCSPRMRFWEGLVGPLSPANFSRQLRLTKPWPSLHNPVKALGITFSYLRFPPGKCSMWRWPTWPAPGLFIMLLMLPAPRKAAFSTPTSACYGVAVSGRGLDSC